MSLYTCAIILSAMELVSSFIHYYTFHVSTHFAAPPRYLSLVQFLPTLMTCFNSGLLGLRAIWNLRDLPFQVVPSGLNLIQIGRATKPREDC